MTTKEYKLDWLNNCLTTANLPLNTKFIHFNNFEKIYSFLFDEIELHHGSEMICAMEDKYYNDINLIKLIVVNDFYVLTENCFKDHILKNYIQERELIKFCLQQCPDFLFSLPNDCLDDKEYILATLSCDTLESINSPFNYNHFSSRLQLDNDVLQAYKKMWSVCYDFDDDKSIADILSN